MELLLFDEVAEALRGLVPDELGRLQLRAHRYGVKTWFGPDKPPREHYEAQVIGPRHVPGAKVLALEIGFHAEHPAVAMNDAALDCFVKGKQSWRKLLGADVEIGPFLGRPDDWRRVSETWIDPDLSDPGMGFEIASRLTDYLIALEPLRPS